MDGWKGRRRHMYIARGKKKKKSHYLIRSIRSGTLQRGYIYIFILYRIYRKKKLFGVMWTSLLHYLFSFYIYIKIERRYKSRKITFFDFKFPAFNFKKLFCTKRESVRSPPTSSPFIFLKHGVADMITN